MKTWSGLCSVNLRLFLPQVTMLTENESVIMSTHNAASWGYYDTVKKSWNEQVIVIDI